MRSALALALILVTSIPMRAQTHSTPLQDAARREAVHRASTIGTVQPPSNAPVRERHWVTRHPVLTGTLVGLGAGLGTGAAACPADGGSGSIPTYTGPTRLVCGVVITGVGAGIGAGVGAVIRAAR